MAKWRDTYSKNNSRIRFKAPRRINSFSAASLLTVNRTDMNSIIWNFPFLISNKLFQISNKHLWVNSTKLHITIYQFIFLATFTTIYTQSITKWQNHNYRYLKIKNKNKPLGDFSQDGGAIRCLSIWGSGGV